MINILIANDSETEIMLLKHIFQQERDLHVVGCAKNGKEAVELASKLKPNIIIMDINMPIIDGFEATRLIMMTNPTPIVVISSSTKDANINTAFLALESGALSVFDRPMKVDDPGFKLTCTRLITLIRSMAEIKVVKRRFSTQLEQQKPITQVENESKSYEIVAIGSSIGGPQALKTILSQLPGDFPVPIVIVQHMTQGFIEGLSEWFDLHCTLTIKCATDQEILQAGTVYFAPDRYHLKIQRVDNNLIAHLDKGDPVSGFYPSITELFNSIAQTCGSNAVAILLTGMGSDGASGLYEIKAQSGHTIIQDPDSCVVFGMASVAQSLGAVDRVLKLSGIANYLVKIIN